MGKRETSKAGKSAAKSWRGKSAAPENDKSLETWIWDAAEIAAERNAVEKEVEVTDKALRPILKHLRV